MIPCCIFTYREDAHETVLAAASAMSSGFWPVFIVEDSQKPLCEETRRTLGSMDCVMISSDFPRPKGLYGLDCFFGICQILKRIMDKTGSALVLKLDPDTLILTKNKIDEIAPLNPLLIGWGTEKYALHGNSEVISMDLVEICLGFIRKWKGIPGYANHDLPEDLAFYRMAVLSDSLRCYISPQSTEGGYGTFWSWGCLTEKFGPFSGAYDTITFGNRMTPDGVKISRVESYMVQSAFLDRFEKCRIPSSSGLRLVV